MYSAEFQISVCCLRAVFVDQKFEVFTLVFLQIFWVAEAASWPHCSLCFYWLYWVFFVVCLFLLSHDCRWAAPSRGALGRQGLAGPSPQTRTAPALGRCHCHQVSPVQVTSSCRGGTGHQGCATVQGRVRHRLWGRWRQVQPQGHHSLFLLPDKSRWK